MKSLLNLTTAIILFVSSSAFALEADLKAFFKNSEGLWRGNGNYSEMVQGGSTRSINYLINFGIQNRIQNFWHVRMKYVFENGVVSYPWGTYQVSGDNLIVITPQINEPVNVLTAGLNALFYKFSHADPATGRVYSYSYKYAICEGGIFKGDVETSLNEVIIAKDHFEAKKEGTQAIEFVSFGQLTPEVADFSAPN